MNTCLFARQTRENEGKILDTAVIFSRACGEAYEREKLRSPKTISNTRGATAYWWLRHPFWSLSWTDWAALPVFMIVFWVISWRFFWTTPRDDFEGYTKAIEDIERIERQLTALLGFLKKERENVLESQDTVNRLRDEQTLLEPVVLTQRETVNAILAAHARTTAASVWKERALGFISGILTSLIATVVFELLRR